MTTKNLTDKQIQEQINELEEENANTQRLSFRRGYGWGDGVLEKRRDKINHLLSILAMRKFDKRKLPGKHKVRNKPKDVRNFGEPVTSGLKTPKIPTGMTLQKSLSKTGGQMHFKNGGGKKKPKTLIAKKTKKRVKRIKKGSDNLMTFGIKMPDVRTLEDMLR